MLYCVVHVCTHGRDVDVCLEPITPHCVAAITIKTKQNNNKKNNNNNNNNIDYFFKMMRREARSK